MNDETEEFFKIKELFFHLNQMIHSTGSKDSYQMLFYLPDTDPNFHKLELVKGVRKYLRESLTPEIEKCVDFWLGEYEGKMREENSMQYLIQKLYQSQLYLNVKSDLETSLDKAISEMSDRPVEEIFFKGNGEASDYPPIKSSPLESNDISLNSSFNQSGYLFINPSQYNNIAESLKKKHLQENFQNALDLLLAVTPGEPVSQSNWPSIRKSLKELLHSENDKIFDKSLRFHSRLLSSQVYNAVKEGFLNIVEALSEIWLSRKLVQRLNKRSQLILKDKTFALIYVLNEFLKEFPALWIRYPTQYVHDMIEAYFSLFEFGNVQKEVLSFFDILSILDPKGLWFHSWMHGQLGRRITLNVLKNKSTLLSCCLSNAFYFIDNSINSVITTSDNKNLQNLEFFKFNHSLSIIFCNIQYSEGRLLFPIYDHLKKDHFTLKKCLHSLAGSIKLLKQHVASKVLLKQFVKCCNCNENLCKLFCEIGIVDALTKVLHIENNFNKFSESKSWYLQSVLHYFASVNSTSIGHEYLLTGKLQKPTSKIILTSNVQTPAQILFHFTNMLTTHQHNLPANVMRLSFNLCCSLLQSPLGRHLFLIHPLIENIIFYLQEEFNIRDAFLTKTLFKIERRGYIEEYFEFVIEKLLLSHRGMLLLEKNNVLMPVMNLTLPQYAVKGKLSYKLLTKIVCSVQGCLALGRNQILKEYWESLIEMAKTEPLVRPPLYVEEMNDILEEALIPLICISSTLEGTKLLYSKLGLLNEGKEYLLNPKKQETIFYSLVLKLLGSSTYNLDGMLILDILLNLQENLTKQQNEAEINGTVIVDENSIMRTHILNCLLIPKGMSNFDIYSFILDAEMPPELNTFDSSTSSSKNAKEKAKGPLLKKQGELWQFLNDTRNGPLDGTWSIQCRRAFRSELLNNEETKVPLLMEMMDLCLDSLLQSPDETLPHVLSDDIEIDDEIPSPISSSFSNSIYCYPPAFEAVDNEERIAASGFQKINQHFSSLSVSAEEEVYPSSSLGMEIMIRYGSELNLIPNNDSQRSNLLKLKLAVDSYLVANKQQRYDWLTVLIYYMTAGNVDKSFSFLRKLKNLKVGVVLWPTLMGSLWGSLKLAPNELLFSSIIHCTKLVLYRDNPTAYLALEDIGGGIIWNIASEWINQSFVGVLPWPENLHIFLVTLLFGGDYLIYALASLLLNLQKTLIERTTDTEFRKIMYIQTTVIQDWKIKDHFLYMDTLCKRFRRIVLDTIYSPLTRAK